MCHIKSDIENTTQNSVKSILLGRTFIEIKFTDNNLFLVI